MTRRHDEKGDETVAFRVPERTASWLRDRSRVEKTTPSNLMRRIVTAYLEGEQQCKQLPPFANNSAEEIGEAMEALKATIERAFQDIGLLRATPDSLRKRERERTA